MSKAPRPQKKRWAYVYNCEESAWLALMPNGQKRKREDAAASTDVDAAVEGLKIFGRLADHKAVGNW